MFKKMLSMLLVVAMLLSMIPAVFAAEAETQGVTAGDNTVSIRVIGSTIPNKKPTISSSKYDYAGAEYRNWLKTTTYKVAEGTTAQQLIEQALTDAGLRYTATSNYFNKLSVYAPEEFGGYELMKDVLAADGNKSGGSWMITVNNHGAYKSENTSKMDTTALEDGDELILHFVWSTSYEKHGKAWESFTWEVPDVSPAEFGTANGAMTLIDAIGRVTPESGNAITAARNAYNALTEDAKTLVTNYETLTAAEATFKAIEDNAATRVPLPAPTISAGTAGLYTYAPNAVIDGVDAEKYTMVYRVSLDGENWGAWQSSVKKLLPMRTYYIQGMALTNDWTTYGDCESVSNVIQVTTAGEENKVVLEVTDKDTLMAALQEVQANGKLYIIDFTADVVIDDIPSETFAPTLPAGANVLMTSSNGSAFYFNEPGRRSYIGISKDTTVTVRDLRIATIAGSSQLTPVNEEHKVFAFVDHGGVINFENVTAYTTHGKVSAGSLVGYDDYNKATWTGTVNIYSGVMNAMIDMNIMYLAEGTVVNLIPIGNIMMEGALGNVHTVNILDLFGLKTLSAVQTDDFVNFSQIDVSTMAATLKYTNGLRLNVTEGITVPPVALGQILVLPADDPNAANADVTYVIHDNDISFTYKDRANAMYQIRFNKSGAANSDFFYTRGDSGALDHTRTYTGLTQDTEYSFTIRFSSLDASFTDVETTVTLKTTYTPVTLAAPTLSDECEKTDSTITVTAPAASAEDTTAVVLYRIRKAGTETWSAWQESLTFTGLEGYTNYEIQAMYKAVHHLWLDSAESNTITIMTKAPALQAPPAVKAEDITAEFDAITVPVPAASSQDPDAVVMYRIGTLKDAAGLLQNRSVTEDQITWGEWQESNVFTGLEADTTYYVQSQYVTEKAEWNNSVLSEIVEIKTATNESAPHFKVESAAGKAGSEVKVIISLNNNPGIVAIAMNVGYEASKLQLVSVQDLRLLPNGTFSEFVTVNPYYLSWEDSTATSNLTVNGGLVILTFKILDGCAVGDIVPVTITYDVGNVYNKDLTQVKFAVINGTVTVISHTWGDATYTWNADHTECTATHSCTCCETAVSESETVSAAIDTVPPTETEKGSTTYTANFTKTGFTTQTYVKVLPATGTLIEIGTAEGCIGEEIKVNVTFAQNPGIAGAELILAYDADKLEFVGFENGQILSKMMTNDKYNGNQLYISWVSDDNAMGDGVVLTLTFKIKDTCAVDEEIAVNIVSFKAHDYDATDVEFNSMDGMVAVADHTWSDWTYTWNADNTACTAHREQTCGCGAVEKQTVKVVLVNKDCTTATYLAHFTNGAEDQVTVVSINDHDYEISGSENGDQIIYTCPECGDSYTETVAAGAGKFVISENTGKRGDILEVTLSITGNPGLTYAQLAFSFDPAALKLVEMKNAGLFENVALDGNILTIGGKNEIGDTTGDGVVATLVFQILADTDQDILISMTYTTGDIRNYNGDSIVMGIDNGKITVYTYLLGDVNRDGVVDIKDVTILRRYLAGTVAGSDVDLLAADCNCDGVVDIKDVTILRRYLAGTAELGK